jgi:hypothetical protein
MPLRNGIEMAAALEQVMTHAYAQLADRQRLDAESSLLKTYLLEGGFYKRQCQEKTLFPRRGL